MTLTEFALALAKGSKVEETDSELVEALAGAAMVARRAGVLPGLEDLVDPLERAAWVAAGDRIEVDRAVRIGTACEGPLGPARVRAELDGGAEHDEAAIAAGAIALAEAHARGAS